MFGESDLFRWGVPETDTDADQFKQMVAQRAAKPLADSSSVDVIDSVLARITDKSAALLQAVSILAAIATVFATQTDWSIVANLSRLALLMSLVTCVLLASNLSLVWARDASVYLDPSADFDLSMRITRKRGKRFTIALRLATFAFLVELFASIMAVSLQMFKT